MYKQLATAQAAHIIHLLVNMRHCIISNKVWNYSKLQLRRHDNTGWSVVIGDSRLGGLVIAIFSRILNLSINDCPSSEAALAFLVQRDPVIAAYLSASDIDPLLNKI